MRCLLGVGLALVSLITVGCGSSNESYLPKPRRSVEDEDLAPAPKPGNTPVSNTPAVATSPPDAPAATSPVVAPPPVPVASAPASTVPVGAGAVSSETELRQRVLAQLMQISQAWEAYREEKRAYPGRKHLLHLSWRVGLLPHLGHGDLYRKFRLTEDWDSPHNQTLLKEIPDVFKGTGRQDEKTRLVLVTGDATAYATMEELSADRCPDGLENTILLAEVNDSLAVPWTAPEDYVFDRATLQNDLFGQHQDCCYVLLGGGVGPRRIAANITNEDLLALITPGGGETVSGMAATGLPHANVDDKLIALLEKKPIERFPPAPPSPSPSAVPAGSAANAGLAAPPIAQEPPLSETEHRRRVLAQLTQISQALKAYRDRHKGAYPSRYAEGSGNKLSWRVQLLPYLGQKELAELAEKFDMQQPWDSPRNRELLSQIPDVYKSAGLPYGRTRLTLVTGPDTAYPDAAGPSTKSCPDGLENTVLLVEADDARAVPWTAPDDYVVNRETLRQDLFGRHEDCCFALLGGRTGPRRIPASVSDEQLLALLTPAGGETLVAADVTIAPTADVDPKLAQELAARQRARLGPPGTEASVASALLAASTAGDGGQDSASPDARLPVPEREQLQAAVALFKAAYADESAAAKSVAQKRGFAQKLLAEAGRLNDDPVGVFVFYGAAAELAGQAGDVATGQTAIRQLTAAYRLEPLPLERKLIERAAAAVQSQAEQDLVFDEALRLGDAMLAEDDFPGARRLYELAQNTARRTSRRDALAQVYRKLELLRFSEDAYQRVTKELHTLQRAPADPAANAAVGRYVSLVQRDWDRGLAMLAKGEDGPLRALALRELQSSSAPDDQVKLGDDWWDWSRKTTAPLERASARHRASYWYRRALPRMPADLAKARVEKRLAELEQASVQEVSHPLAKQRASAG